MLVSTSRRGGIVIGKFMPPHAGHQYLIQFARSFTPEITVFVCTLSHEPIPGELRFAWMSRLFPNVHLVHITEEIPAASRSSAGAHEIWAEAVRTRLETNPRYVFASESYGADLAGALGAQFVPVDPRREVFPVSAGMIREHPLAHWRYIPAVVRPYFARKIAVVSADSRSAARLVEELAQHYQTPFATDYAAYLQTLELAGPTIHGPEAMARAQAASEAALLEQANRFLFTPTEVLWTLTRTAGEHLQPGEAGELADRLAREFPHLAPALVVAVDAPERYREAVRRRGWTLVEAATMSEADRLVRQHADRWLTNN